MSGFLIRDIAPADLDDLQKAAVHLDSVNLPDDREALEQIIDRSRRSFAAVASGASEPPAKDRCLVFVAEQRDSGAVVGTSMIFPQHGSRKAPHVYFDVLEEERYSETLDRHFAHRVLRIGYNYKGLTEVGGLVVRPEFRRHPERLGRLLMSIRFLYIARHRTAFRDEVLSELMPPLEADGTSLLWESLGRKFTGLTLPGGGPPVPEQQGVHPGAVSAGSAVCVAAAGARAGADRSGRARYEGGREGAARDRVQLRAPDRSVRRRAAFPGAHRRHHAGPCDANGARGRRRGRARCVGRSGHRRPGADRGAVFHRGAHGDPRRGAASRSRDVAAVTLPLAADARDALQVAPGDEIAYLRLP